MVCLLQSRLFRETRIPASEFIKVFGRPPDLTVDSCHSLLSFLELCEYFIIDCPPFEDVLPYQHILVSMDPKEIPPHLLKMYSSLCVALTGDVDTMLKHGCTKVLEWVHRHRYTVTSHAYIKLLCLEKKNNSFSEKHLLDFMNTLWSLGVASIPSFALELALQQKKQAILEWMLPRHVPLTSYHLSVAIRYEYPISFLQTMTQIYQCPIHTHTVATACSTGRLDVVQWWYQQRFPFCSSSAAWAALFGQGDVLRYLVNQRDIPINWSWTRGNAQKSKDPHTIRLVHEFEN